MQDIYDKTSFDYNRADVVAQRKLDRARKNSRIAIVLAFISVAYIYFLVFMPEIHFSGVPGVLMWIADKILMYILPLLGLLCSVFGFQEQENEIRIPALIISIILIIVVVAIFIFIITSSTDVIVRFLKDTIGKGNWST